MVVMQEVFEKIKERLNESSWWTTSTFDCDGYSNDDSEEVITLNKAIEIVNQVAEEYDNDFCEWHKVKNGNAYKCNTHEEIHDSRVLDWYVCPYCEKKIKVVE